MRRHAIAVAACAAGIAVLGGCGKKGPPLAPLRPLPARIADITARAVDALVHISMIVPAENADGTTPSVIERVDLYALAVAPLPGALPAAPPGGPPAPPPAAAPISPAAVILPDNLAASAAVPPPTAPAGAAGGAASEEASSAVRLTITHDVSAILAQGAAAGEVPVVRYVVVGVGRGRRGQPSAVLEVPLGQRPAAPDNLAIAYDESTITMSWTAPAAGIATHVDEVGAEAGESVRRSAEPAVGTSFSLPVTFGERRCFTARHVVTSGRAAVEGPASTAVCVTPTDTFAPPSPGALGAIAEEGAVVLTWRGVQASDLAGYVVLRGEGANETLQPLTRLPVTETSYRDATIRAGVTYTYAVVAVDRAVPFNQSVESNRQTVTARQ